MLEGVVDVSCFCREECQTLLCTLIKGSPKSLGQFIKRTLADNESSNNADCAQHRYTSCVLYILLIS